ncbi:hypothetical protein [Nocardia sp. NPDC052566]|uniref:hypothetical protein n=1 Tax=Nocardia sp. NPDC052566 TaxID=3364330 RepID=UPI0037C76DF7
MAFKIFLNPIEIWASAPGTFPSGVYAKTSALIFEGDGPVPIPGTGAVPNWHGQTDLRSSDSTIDLSNTSLRQRLVDQIKRDFERSTGRTGTYEVVWVDKLW